MTDAEKIATLNTMFDRFADWDRRPSKASGKRLEQAIAAVLAIMLGRQPTAEEVKAACQ